jgi:predicted phosphodiesterase
MALIKFVVATDNHGHLVDEVASRNLVEFCADYKPRHRIHLGDLWDAAPLRKAASDSERMEGLQADWLAGLAFLDAYRPNILTLGNHDARYWDLMASPNGVLREKGEQLVAAATEEFKRRKITWVPYHASKFLRMPEGGPVFIHGFRTGPSAVKNMHAVYGACMFGHTHTYAEHSTENINGGGSVNVPAMADFSKMSYADRSAGRNQWRNGWTMGTLNEKTGSFKTWTILRDGDDWLSPLGKL